jgi:hypothetical protein
MLPLSYRFLSVAALSAVALVACSNISLSSSENTGAAAPGASGTSAIDADVDGGGIPLAVTSDAAATAPALTGSPLCNYGFADTTSHTCLPDSDDAGAQQCLLSVADAATADLQEYGTDAAAPTSGGVTTDAGTLPGSAQDSGVALTDAGPILTPACHVVETTADGGLWRTQTCTVAGTGAEGAQCQVSTDCAATYECVETPGQCRHYCCDGNSACDGTYTPSFCDVQPVVSGKFNVPVCVPISHCSLFGTCPTGETCAVVKDDGTTSCVDVGDAQAGDPCDETHCASGLTCLGNSGSRTCFKLCHVDTPSDCPSGTTCSGSAQLFTDPAYGICQ